MTAIMSVSLMSAAHGLSGATKSVFSLNEQGRDHVSIEVEMQNQYQVLLWIYVWLLKKAFGITFPESVNLEGVKIMIRVPADNADVSISGSMSGEATDSEGNTVPVSFVEPTSDNASAFELRDVVVAEDGNSFTATGVTGGPESDGSPALATVKFAIKRDDTGVEVWQQANVIQVSAGAPTDIPVTIDLGGLVDEPEGEPFVPTA
jgi:hypothetical protein